MTNPYARLALSYRGWHYRMTTEALDHSGPAVGFSAMQSLNVFSILLLLPIERMPEWIFVGSPFVIGFAAFLAVTRIYRNHPVVADYATDLASAVPRVGEFPAVYAYLLFTLLFFVGSVYLVIRSMP